MTVTIAISALIYLKNPKPEEQGLGSTELELEEEQHHQQPIIQEPIKIVKCAWIKNVNVPKTIALVVVFGFGFNISRWFEIKTVQKMMPVRAFQA